MKPPRPPVIEARRTREFSDELLERARVWMPDWAAGDAEGDFGRALLEIAARFNSEVAERLDGAGEKLRRGFLDYLGVHGEAARPARMPVVFQLAETAQEPVLASPPVRMNVDADGTSVIFEAETETDLRLVPGKLDLIVGLDAGKDAIYFPPGGLSDLSPLEQLPTQWQLKSFASAGSTKLQLDPDVGLAKGLIIEAGGGHYRIDEAENGIVTIDPPLETGLDANLIVRKVETFAPFDGVTRYRQEHALYIGHNDLLNIEAAATIDIVGAGTLIDDIEWQYWGKSESSEESGWQTLKIVGQKPDALVLKKEKGEIEPKKIGEIGSRWIRAVRKNLGDPSEFFTADELTLRINCNGDSSCPSPNSADSGISVEAMANTTPLVLSEPFFPLGRVPQQFDAFYLASTEAFSKPRATAKVCFEMSDATCRGYTVVRSGSFANQGTLVGVGEDLALHLFKTDLVTGAMARFRGPLRPPLPASSSSTAKPPQNAPSDLNPRCFPAVWNDPANGQDFFVAVASKGDIWIWHEKAGDAKNSGWLYHSRVPGLPDRPSQVESIIVLKSSPASPGLVLSNGRLWIFNGTEWRQPLLFPSPPDTPLRDYAVVAPVLDPNLEPTDAIVAVSVDQNLYSIETDPVSIDYVKEVAIPLTVSLDVGSSDVNDPIPTGGVQPAAIKGTGPLEVVAVSGNGTRLVAKKVGSLEQIGDLDTDFTVLGAKVAVWSVGSKLEFSVSASKSVDNISLASWIPTFVNTDAATIYYSSVKGASGTVGSPFRIGINVGIPGGNGDAFVAPFNPAGRLDFTGVKKKLMLEGVIVPQPEPFQPGDIISALTRVANVRKEWTIQKAAARRGTSDCLYLVDTAIGSPLADNPQLMGYSGPGIVGNVVSATKFVPLIPDPNIVPEMLLRIEVVGHTPVFCEVDSVDALTGQVTVKTATVIPGNANVLLYWRPIPKPAEVLPAVEFDPSGDGNWDVSILKNGRLYFDSAIISPSIQEASAFGVIANHPTVIALERRWTSMLDPLNTPQGFVIDGVIGPWRKQLADTASNPALSWEYWNGKGWWSLEIIKDATDRLANTGDVSFKIPDDIAESDWAGKSNFWIRARLVGGDYGKEEVSFISRPIPDSDDTEQIVKRSTDNIRSPQVLSLRVTYSNCDGSLPDFVLAEDSGLVVDQSDANRTGGAIVEGFIPVGQMLGRLSGAPIAEEDGHPCLPGCDCHRTKVSDSSSASSVTLPGVRATPALGRSLFIGLDANISAGPVSVLLLVEKENDHLEFAPMKVEALVAGRFIPIVADDGTRALSESGVLLMSFAVAPTLANLFGKTCTWLRLTPKTQGDNWIPSIRGAYLNAVFASSKETLTRELLGSSDGSPNLTLSLARPPVLRDTLELRVLEPLGDEERSEITVTDPAGVLSGVEDLPGDWVLWKQVIDPDDEAPAARVYSLDETTGEIRFGDGIHGRIPPIGRNSIVAFSYSRTESGTAGNLDFPPNSIKPRTPLNLVSPVESVESVIAADQSAGGAPPEPNERVVKTGFARFRHRGRAVSARDLEDLAIQSSPDIAQAMAVVRPGKVRLIVVMKGSSPTPSAVQRRELPRLLLEASPVSMSAPRALQIAGPGIRKLRIDLVLQVARLEHSARASTWVKDALSRFFDTALGGVDGDGWPLGERPSEDDIAFVLSDAPLIVGIGDIKLRESLADGRAVNWPDAIKPTEIVVLAEDPVRITFTTAEAEV